jgi:hypothetical protein
VQGHLYRYPHPYDATKFIYVGQGAKRDRDHRSGRSSFGRRFKNAFPGVELSQPVRETVEVVDQEHLNGLETAWMILYQTWRGQEGGMNLMLPGSDEYQNMGRIGGRKNVESGHLAKIRELPHAKAAYRENGRKAVESGQLDSIRELPQSKATYRENGHKAVESGHVAKILELPQTKAAQRESGRKNVESGHLAKIRELSRELPQTKAGQREGGRKAVESGQLASVCAKGGRIGGRVGMCMRWNIRCNKPCVCGKHEQKAA